MRSTTRLLVTRAARGARAAALATLPWLVAACSEPPRDGGRGTNGSNATSAKGGAARADASVASAGAAADGGVAEATDAGSMWDGPLIGALFQATPIMSDMEWPIPEEKLRPGEKQRSIRIGYIRQGAWVPVIPEAHRKPNCTDGWYELVQGGFVCGKFATLDRNHPKIRNAPHLPDLSGALPYQYGYNLTNGTPLYKHIPSREERLRYEPWLAGARVRPRPRPRVEDDVYGSTSDLDGGIIPAVATAMGSATDPFGLGGQAPDEDDAGVPWYLRDYDGGKPTVTLDDLNEDDGGPIEKRMIKGFYLSLDKMDTHFGAKWWRTQKGLYTPYERIYVPPKPITEFHGIWLNQDTQPVLPAADVTADAGLPPVPKRIDKLPIGFVLNSRARKYVPSDDGTKMVADDHVGRFTIVAMTGKTRVVDRMLYQETEEGWWMRSIDGTVTKTSPPPPDLAPNEKWIDVNLKNETLVAFEGTTPVYATIISSGKRDLHDKEHDHRTHNGTFRIREKHIAATMDADTATDGPYSIEDVPWIQYFNGSIALHGAFWHSHFGYTKSHGCVNLAPWDAKALFFWTDPPLPQGWHGVHATDEHPGTRIVLHDEQKPLYDTTTDE